MSEKAWGGRFIEPTDRQVEAFTESISFDSRLAAVDVRGSQAHARMLAEAGLITTDEQQQIAAALDGILQEIERGDLPFRQELEDIHLHIESRLIALLGDVGRKLHTARSRNDQIATDIRLYVRDEIDRLDGLLVDLQRAFVHRCEADHDIVLPAYTHLQRAQPVLANHYWLCWCEKLERDRSRLADCRKRTNVCSLGAAALAGTTLPIDRRRTAELLGFEAVAANSLDVSSDRDFLVELTSVLSLIALHLSSWAEEWILWCTTEFGLLTLPDAFTTGSSIMPQKKNPDVLELIRGKSARAVGSTMQMMVLVKGLPLAYNRDLQEDKLAAFAAIDSVADCLAIAPQIVAAARLNRDRIEARLEDGFLDATALMEYLIRQGEPMRSGHEVVGRLVGLCEQRRCRLADLTLEELQQASARVAADVYNVLGAKNAAQALSSYGSGGPAPVAEQVQLWRTRLGPAGGAAKPNA